MAYRVVILGGGISGLTSAWNLKRRYRDAVEITVIEQSARLGGWIETDCREGFLFEFGPRSCRGGEAVLRLIEELGLKKEILFSSPAARLRYIWRGRLYRVPTGLCSALLSPLTLPLIKPLLTEWLRPKSGKADESIAEFISRRLGHHAAHTLIDPLVAGIYAGDIEKLSIKSCFPSLYQLEANYGSITRGLMQSTRAKSSRGGNKIFTLRAGMERLIEALESQLEVNIIKGCKVRRVVENSIHTEQGVVEADEIISALPSHALFSLFGEPLLQTIPFISVAVVCFGYRKKVLPLEGFGYLIPSSQKEQLLGVVWDSSVFPEQNTQGDETRLTCMIKEGPLFNRYTAEDFTAIAMEGLQRHLRITARPDVVAVKLAKKSIPQYTVGHQERLAEIKRALPIQIVGSSYGGVSVNDCIAQSVSELTKISF